jgi:hypothetical protein
MVEGTEAYAKAVQYMIGGGNIEKIEEKYTLTSDLKHKLLNS